MQRTARTVYMPLLFYSESSVNDCHFRDACSYPTFGTFFAAVSGTITVFPFFENYFLIQSVFCKILVDALVM